MIDGLQLTPLREIPDDRGIVRHMLRATDPAFAGFGEVYFSTVKSGMVKAWKRHRAMTLNVVCVHGAIRFVCYDDRAGSPTCGQFQEIALAPITAYQLATIPPGVWTGFLGTAAGESILCNCASIPHDPAESDRLPPEHSSIPYNWNR
jgi:dTDP-4-dehydrorhamnose 3,5-epimerase